MELFLDILPILLLVMLSAFFSGSETAMTAASQPRMLELERQEVAAAGIVNRLRARTDRLIGAILFGNNLVNILASALATGLFIGWFGSNGVFYATIVMTLLVLIFAEVMPKAYAINHADSTALRTRAGPARRRVRAGPGGAGDPARRGGNLQDYSVFGSRARSRPPPARRSCAARSGCTPRPNRTRRSMPSAKCCRASSTWAMSRSRRS